VSDAGRPHAQNAAGPFYVVDGCCTACGVPETVAPELFAYDSANRCYVKRQPATPEETEHALHVVRGQELGCVRYRGTDRFVLHRLAEADASRYCDPPLEGVESVLRNTVTFSSTDEKIVSLDEFAEHMRRATPWSTIRTKKPSTSWGSVFRRSARTGCESLLLSWYLDDFHRLTLSPLDESPRRWRIHHDGPLGLSESLDRWLSESPGYDNVLWFSETEWTQQQAGQRRPW
jgi:ferredoxin